MPVKPSAENARATSVGSKVGKRASARSSSIGASVRIVATLAAHQRVVDVGAQVLAHLALDLVGMRDDLVEAAVLQR